MNKPIKPNIIIPEAFAVDGIKTDFTADKLQNGFNRIQPDVLAGDNLNKLIDDTYKGLNYAMAGTDAINLIQEDEVLTVKNGELVSSKVASGANTDLSNLSTTGQAKFDAKVDQNASNLNAQGKSYVSGLGMPSNKYINLTLGANDSTYTAPANGWFQIIGIGDKGNLPNVLSIYNKDSSSTTFKNFTRGIFSCAYGITANSARLEVKKGDEVVVSWDATTFSYGNYTNLGLKFIYAEGEV